MKIEHTQIKSFAEDRINLPRDDAQKHRDQVNRLRERLAKKISEDRSFGLVKMLHSGSVAKGTALGDVDDLDAAVYVHANDHGTDDKRLIPWLADKLFDANPNMKRDQFVPCDHCVRVSFRGSGLDVDVAPVLYEGDPDDRGYLVRKNSGQRVLTSIPLHLNFIRARKKTHNSHFAQLIRITKWWKRIVLRREESFRFKSFLMELLWAHLADAGVDLSDYPSALEAFFGYIIRTDLEERVTFTDFGSPTGTDPAAVPVQIIDPVNPDNNVAAGYTQSDRDRMVAHAQDAFDAITEARHTPTKGTAVECWRVVLGPAFRG